MRAATATPGELNLLITGSLGAVWFGIRPASAQLVDGNGGLMPILTAIFEFLFGCHHNDLSRAFTIRTRTYKVCMDCGAEFDYSLQTMSLANPHEPLRQQSAVLHGGRLMLTTPSKIAIAVVVSLLTACALPAPLLGQSVTAVQQTSATAEIPFEFLTLDTRCPAGHYSVAIVGPTHLLIRNEKERVAAEVFTIPDPGFPVDDKSSKLVFVERDGKTYLVGIVDSHGFQRVTGLYGMTQKNGDVRKEITLNYSARRQ